MRTDAWFLISLFAVGCTAAPADTESLNAAIELENGGLDETDEPPAFADPALFSTVDEPAPVDAMASDPAMTAPEVARLRVLALWGQLPPDRAPELARDWSGRLQLNRGGMIVR